MKFPSTTGGAAGSLVRGNAFAENAPTPYSSTRRGQDLIQVSPGQIRVSRKASELRMLEPELLTCLRFTKEQAKESERYSSAENADRLGWHMRRLTGVTISEAQDEQTIAGDQTQQEIWQFPGSTQQIGRLVYVGDNYFVSVGHPYDVDAYENYDNQAASLNRPRVALIHKNNLNGPYLNTVTRTLHQEGGTWWFHKPPAAGGGRGGDGRQVDAFGSNYYLQECEDLLQREVTLSGQFATGFGPKVSAVPLGWVDDVHRYAFAVFGLSNRERGDWRHSCYVYCTGTRALLHTTTQVANPSNAPGRWTGMTECAGYCAQMAGVGRGQMAMVLIPFTVNPPHPEREDMGYGAHKVNSGFDPCLVFSTDFGRSWQVRALPELQSLAKPTQDGGFYYPPLQALIVPTSRTGEFLVGVAAWDEHPSGDVPSAEFDDDINQQVLEGIPANGSSAGSSNSQFFRDRLPERASWLTFFKGSLHGAWVRAQGIDSYRLRFGHWLGIVSGLNEATAPPGTYRYNLLLNAANTSAMPYVRALGEGSVALVARTMEVTIPPRGNTAWPLSAFVFREIETFVLSSEDGGQTWSKAVLPQSMVPFNDPLAYLRASDPLNEQDVNRAPTLPGRDFLSWCVIARPRAATKPGAADFIARIACVVPQVTGNALYVSRHKRQGRDGEGAAHSPWLVRKLKSLSLAIQPPVAASRLAWDFARTEAPSALLYVGDPDSEDFPDYLNPALPDLFKDPSEWGPA